MTRTRNSIIVLTLAVTHIAALVVGLYLANEIIGDHVRQEMRNEKDRIR